MKSDSTIAPAPLKRMAQTVLKQTGLYQHLRSSCVYDFYWTFTNPKWLANRTREIKFLNVLRGLKQSVPYLSFEVNLPEFKEEALECIRVLIGITAAGEFNYVADYDEGLKFRQWMPAMEFVRAFGECRESAIEMFWRPTR